jgi:hypothetical protein
MPDARVLTADAGQSNEKAQQFLAPLSSDFSQVVLSGDIYLDNPDGVLE